MSTDNKKGFFATLTGETLKFAKDLAVRMKEYNAEFAETELAAAEGALKDGTPFKYTGDKLDKGSVVTVVTEGGEVPMPVGEYVLPDDSVMVVVQDGENSVVSEVKAAAPEDMSTEAKDLADVKERVTKIVEKFEAQFSAQENENKKLKSEVEKLKLKVAKQASLLTDTFSVMEAFGSQETDTPAETPKTNLSKSNNKKLNLV
jgi:hypothetical protein